MNDHAVLLIHCPDQKGIVHAVTQYLLKNEGNVIDIDQHVDGYHKHFFMRVEWDLTGFQIDKDQIEESFNLAVAKQYKMTWTLNFTSQRLRLALFVSKASHCLYDILSRYQSGEWQIDIPFVMSNHTRLEKVVEKYDIPYFHIPISKENKIEQEEKQMDIIRSHRIDVIVLARYMQILSDGFVNAFKNQIINIHHSSLPAFIGANPYKAAFERGVKFMGATGHYVTTNLDEGPIISQDILPISHVDSIEDMKRKGRDIEKIVLAKAVWSHMNHKVIVHKNKTIVFD